MKRHVPATRRWRRWLVQAPRFEILPVPDALARVAALRPGTTVTVTASPRHGVAPTVALAEQLADRGYDAVPHLAARQFTSEAELSDVLSRLATAGVRDLFVVGSDVRDAAGPFPDGLALLKAIDASGHSFERIGVPSYPEGHPLIDDDVLWQSLRAKQRFASYTVTQMCFDAATIAGFVAAARARGIDLPVVVGIPGAVSATKLLRMSMRLGVGESVRFVRGHRSVTRRLLTPGAYRTDTLLRGLAAQMTGGRAEFAGLHIYTFNEVTATVRWLEQRHGAAIADEERAANDHAV